MLALLLACADPPPDDIAWPAQGLALTGATLIDADGRHEDRTLILANGHIFADLPADERLPDSIERLPMDGRFILPGFIDSHVHLAYGGAPWWVGDSLANDLRAQLAWGVVGVQDLGGPTWTFALRDAIADGELVGPRIAASGPMLTAEGSHPCESVYDRRLCRFVSGEADGRALLDEGADALKIALQDASFSPWPTPRLALEDLAALCAIGAPTWVHVGESTDARDAIDAGCRQLAHVPFGDPVGALDADVVLSTISALDGVARVIGGANLDDAEFAHVDPAVLESWRLAQQHPELLLAGWPEASAAWGVQAMENLGALRASGTPLLAGSDAGYYFVPHGAALHRELEALVAAGVDERAAIAAATSEPAALLGWDDLGHLGPGARADLLVLNADPLDDIRNTRDVAAVALGGALHTPSVWMSTPLGRPESGFCLEDADCEAGRCDRVEHQCSTACTAWGDEGRCGPEAWCPPADGLDGDGACRAEPTCDWRDQDCAPASYAETCLPRDRDTATCAPAGGRGQGEPCGEGCAEGLYCSPVSEVCLQLCDPASPDCAVGTCHPVLDGEDRLWFGLCW